MISNHLQEETLPAYSSQFTMRSNHIFHFSGRRPTFFRKIFALETNIIVSKLFLKYSLNYRPHLVACVYLFYLVYRLSVGKNVHLDVCVCVCVHMCVCVKSSALLKELGQYGFDFIE